MIVRIDAVEAKAVGAVEGGEIERAAETARVAEHDVARTGAVARRWSADDQVGEAVAVDVARPAHRGAE